MTGSDDAGEVVAASQGAAARIERPKHSVEASSDDDVKHLNESYSSNSTAEALLAVARTQPFMRNFVRCAHDRFPARFSPETRVDKMIKEHPRWYQISLFSDYVLMVVVFGLLLATACLMLWKTFFVH